MSSSSPFDRDVLFAQLIEMGFSEEQAAAASAAFPALDAAIEALLRGDVMPAPATAEPPSNTGDESGEVIPDELMPSQWLPLECAISTADVELDTTTTTAVTFDVLHATIALPTSAATAEWTRHKLQAAFRHAAAGSTAECDSTNSCSSSPSTSPSESDDDTISTPSIASVTITSSPNSCCATPRDSPLDDGDDDLCQICLASVKDTLLVPCQHIPLCSDCALDYFARTRTHNFTVHQLRESGQLEDRLTRAMNSNQKTVMRAVACPQCTTPAVLAIRRRTNVA